MVPYMFAAFALKGIVVTSVAMARDHWAKKGGAADSTPKGGLPPDQRP